MNRQHQHWLWMALICVFLVACASNEARENLAKAELAYVGAAETAIELREAGVIERGSDTEQRVTDLLVTANLALIEANQAIRAGHTDIAASAIRSALASIARVTRELEAEND